MRTFHVKNFDRFQHYKDRAPPWIKLYNELLDDYEFGRLPDASKMHLIAIWLLASRSENKIPYDSEWISRRINATDPVDLDALVRFGFIILDQELRSVEQHASNTLAECLPRERGETEGEKKDTRASALDTLDDWPEDFRERFWAKYPNKVGKADAVKKLDAARKRGDVTWAELDAGLDRYIGKADDRLWCNPATWIFQQRWTDQPAQSHKSANNQFAEAVV